MGPHSCPRDMGRSHEAPRDISPDDGMAPPDDGMRLDNIAPPDGMVLDNVVSHDGIVLPDNMAPPGDMDRSHEASHDGRKEEAQSKVPADVKGPGAGKEAQSQQPIIQSLY